LKYIKCICENAISNTEKRIINVHKSIRLTDEFNNKWSQEIVTQLIEQFKKFWMECGYEIESSEESPFNLKYTITFNNIIIKYGGGHVRTIYNCCGIHTMRIFNFVINGEKYELTNEVIHKVIKHGILFSGYVYDNEIKSAENLLKFTQCININI